MILIKIARQHRNLLFFVILGLPCLLVFEYLSLNLLFRLTKNDLNELAWFDFLRFYTGINEGDTQNLAIFTVLVLFSIRVSLGFLHTALTILLGRLFQRDLNFNVYESVVCTANAQEVASNGVGFYVNIAGEGAAKVSQIFITSIRMIEGLLTVIATFVVLTRTSPTHAVLFVIFGMFSGLFVYAIFKVVYHLGVREFSQASESAAVFVESINNFRSIQALLSQWYFLKKYGNSLTMLIHGRIKIEVLRAAQKNLPAILLLLMSSVFLNPWHPFVKTLDPLMIIGLIVVTIRLMGALGGIVTAIGGIYSDWSAISELDKLRSEVLLTNEHLNPTARIPMVRSVKVDNINYSYPSSVRPLFLNLSCILESGHSYALTGPSGAGKSTFVDLLSGNIVPNSGQIFIDNLLVNSDDLRKLVLVVEQSPKMFSMSIRENLTLGHSYSDANIFEVLRDTGLEEFVAGLDAGLDTKLNYQAGNVSGGQLQRLSLARALLQKPAVLVLDESTTGLDPEVKNKVIANLKYRMKKGIILFITHDVEVASQVDICLNMQDGIFT